MTFGEEVNHGSDHYLEVLCQTIQRVASLCRSRNQKFPEHLVLQADNTVAQTKNQFVMLFIAWLPLALLLDAGWVASTKPLARQTCAWRIKNQTPWCSAPNLLHDAT